jgi:hypothetical protein
MAREYTPNFMQDDDQNSSSPQTMGTGASIPTGSSGASKTKRTGSSGFTNLKKYFQANQGNQLIQNVAQPAEQKAQSALQDISQAREQFGQQIQGEKAKLESAGQKSQQALNYIDTGNQPLIQQTLPENATEEQKTAAAIEANKAAQQSLNKLRDYNYTGPTEISQKDRLAQNQFELKDFADATKSEAGRGAILQTIFGKGGNYTAGSRNLDNYLLGSDKANLDKLKQIRSQTENLGQQLKQSERDAAANIAAMQGNIGVAKGIQKNAMQQLRDAMRQKLEAEASAYNTAQKADAAQIDTEELRKYLPELAGYNLVNDPNAINLAVEGQTTPSNFINLMNNKNFEEWQKVDPNRQVHASYKQSGDLGHRDWTHDRYGRPNTQDVLLDINALKPLFSESYKDNTWDSINAAALERRNILSNVLMDNVEQGLMTPKQKQEIETKMDSELLDKLKALPQRAEEAYLQRFLTNNPSGSGEYLINRAKDLGYDNLEDLYKDLNLNMSTNVRHRLNKDGKLWNWAYNMNSSHAPIAQKYRELYLKDSLNKLLNSKSEDVLMRNK